MQEPALESRLEALYRRRFEGTADYRRRMWAVLCKDWFQRWIPERATVLEMGAGHGEFIDAIRAEHKIAVDLNPDTARLAGDGVRVVTAPSTAVDGVPDGSVDVVFMSNFLEHLERAAIVATLGECRRLLRPDGSLLILQPNIRFVSRDYWMFFDHVTPIDDRALCEVLEITGFRVRRCIPRFLPYTTQSRLPKNLWLVRLYLRLPLLWRLFGGQAFVVAQREDVKVR